jgi:hypothetical protein
MTIRCARSRAWSFVSTLDPVAHCLGCQAEPTSNLLVGPSLDELGKQIMLALREVLERQLRAAWWAHDVLVYPGRCLWAEHRGAVMDRHDGAYKIIDGGVLQQVTASSGP